MYKVQKNGITEFIGRMGQCWIYLRDRYGQLPVKEIFDMGYSIKSARKGL